MSGAFQTVHLRVNDAATGRPTPVRLRCTGADGTYYPPFGRLKQVIDRGISTHEGNVLIDGNLFAYIDGTCEIRLPVGPIRVEIHKGPEYIPVVLEVPLGPGKLALRLTIERWTDERQQGWYSGEFGAHQLTPHAALLEGACEDLAILNLLAQETLAKSATLSALGEERINPNRRETSNLLAFSGQRPALELPGHLVVVNTLNTHWRLGRLALLNAHRIVYPLHFGDSEPDNWSLADWCDQCHRKGGLVVWESPSVSPRNDESPGGEALADLILGKVDALGVALNDLADWYALLDCGLRATLFSASCRVGFSPLGRVRTYAHLRSGEDFNYKNWIEAVRAGRTYATEGPLLNFTVNGEEPGTNVAVSLERATVQVVAQARSLVPFDRLELISNGKVIATSAGSGSPCTARFDLAIPIHKSGWLSVRCWGGNPEQVLAHASPVFVHLGDQPILAPTATVGLLLAQLDHTLAWVTQEARWETDAQGQRLAGVLQQARQRLALLPTV